MVTSPPVQQAAAAVQPAAGADIPWALFGFAFTVFPAAVIIVSEVFMKGNVPAPSADKGPKAEGELNNAEEIFMSGMENLGKDPTGWLFGKPSPLYSNEPPPAPPPAPEPTPEPVGMVTPTASEAAAVAAEESSD